MCNMTSIDTTKIIIKKTNLRFFVVQVTIGTSRPSCDVDNLNVDFLSDYLTQFIRPQFDRSRPKVEYVKVYVLELFR